VYDSVLLLMLVYILRACMAFMISEVTVIIISIIICKTFINTVLS